ncbi:MAG: zinc-binding dehydrogenase [Planctomycetes bacterium]|nr:zinc-binding dehydrogenase [Planctomycetota bacterium]
MARLLERRVRILGSTLRTRPADERAALAAAFTAQVLPRFDEGRLRPVVGAVLPMSAVAEAHALMERNETFGKIVLTW